MNQRTNLDGGPVPIPIAPGGYSLLAPGVSGTVSEMTEVEDTTRAGRRPVAEPLLAGLRGADIHHLKSFEIDVSSTPAIQPTTRGAGALATPEGEPAIVLRTPSLGVNTAQAVLYRDEAGVAHWIFPEPPGPEGTDTTFLLPRDRAPDPPPSAAGETRGVLTRLGRRMVHVLVWATEDIVGNGALHVATNWEQRHRPYRLGRFPVDDTRPVSAAELTRGRSLLLVHGTFSTAQTAFGLVPSDTLNALAGLYAGRIFAFEHPTLYHSPTDNVQTLLGLLPPDADVELDVVTHSRGGLVGRELIERQFEHVGARARVRRAVFVAAPNRGTILTDTEHGIAMLDRYTNLFTALPDTELTVAAEALFMVAKLLYHGAFRSLPGLRSMYPSGEYLRRLNATERHDTEYFALAADYKPGGASLLSRFGWKLTDAVVDDVFREANDGVVPTNGGFEINVASHGFPIPATRRVVYPEADGIHHLSFFGDPRTSRHLLDWLGADSA
jgi:hypothetical protein